MRSLDGYRRSPSFLPVPLLQTQQILIRSQAMRGIASRRFESTSFNWLNLLPLSKGGLRALRNQPPLLLGQRRVEVQHVGIGVRSELGHDEGDTLCHQARDECHVTRQAIELGHDHRTLAATRDGKGWLVEAACRARSHPCHSLPRQIRL